MAGGVAADVRARYPAMHDEYQRLCRDRRVGFGSASAWTAPDGSVVFNLATQDRPGRNADLGAVESSVGVMLREAQERGLGAVGMPRIGAGIGGLEWPDVEAVLERAAQDSPVEVVVVTRPPRRAR